ncbi:hypothetical protein D3H64_04975 [Atopobacter sp. AH10]|uniref:bifunctional folylpolyglutamate synthase/dihydrofolate synthase n=1 Tax=Atopobacter sp. AH10 TaxID=2315861 RepID=UPI000EF1AC0D|nr:Mur ligase family protein [Atopobacter sp. AH10]RLK63336.1 hypothetical protein D3H64_04975 [Atopobacter sp. AH10]
MVDRRARTSIHLVETRYGEGDRLSSMKKVLEALNHPDHAYEIIHLSGTNGKGSTASMIGAFLEVKGQKVGYFTSPYFDHPREMIQMNGEWISLESFERYEKQILGLVEKLLGDQTALSEFEVAVCIALLYFKDQAVDTLVLECGLGGSLDATNAVDRVNYSIFTPISLDHMNILGRTVKEIAENKAGMIRQGDRVISAYPQKAETQAVLERICQERVAYLTDGSAIEIRVEDYSDEWISNGEKRPLRKIDLRYPDWSSYQFHFSLLGHYQLQNLRTVACFLKDYADIKSLELSHRDFEKAFSHLTLRGRFECLDGPVLTILDGGHNVAGIKELSLSVKEWFKGCTIIGVSAFLKDKQVLESLPYLDFLDQLIVTQAFHPERAMKADELGALYKEVFPNLSQQVIKDPEEAILSAYQLAEQIEKEKRVVLVVFGSFHLLKKIRPLVMKFHKRQDGKTRLI